MPESGIDTQAVKLPFYIVFHGLDIVVGGLFYLFHFCSLFLGHVLVDGPQGVIQSLVKPFQLRQGQLAQGYEILYLNSYPVSDQGKFRIIGREVTDLSVVPSVNG